MTPQADSSKGQGPAPQKADDATPDRPPRAGRLRKLALLGMTLLISAGFSLLLLAEIDFPKMLRSLSTADLWPLPLAITMTFLGFVVMTLRLSLLLRPLGGSFFFRRIFKAQLVGFAGNNVLPMRMGELIRIDYLARHGGVPHSSILATVGVERLFDLLTLGLLFAALFPVVLPVSGTTRVTIFGCVLFSLFSMAVAVARWPRGFTGLLTGIAGIFSTKLAVFVGKRAEFFAQGLAALRSPATWALALLTSMAYWGAALVFCRLLIAAFHLAVPWYAPGVVLVFGAMAGLLPSAPAYVGTYHYFVMLALKTLGVDAAVAASFAILMHFTALVPFTVVTLLFLFRDVFRGGGGGAENPGVRQP